MSCIRFNTPAQREQMRHGGGLAFDQRQALLDVAKLQKDVNVARYERAIQSAFKENKSL